MVWPCHRPHFISMPPLLSAPAILTVPFHRHVLFPPARGLLHRLPFPSKILFPPCRSQHTQSLMTYSPFLIFLSYPLVLYLHSVVISHIHLINLSFLVDCELLMAGTAVSPVPSIVPWDIIGTQLKFWMLVGQFWFYREKWIIWGVGYIIIYL